MYHRTNPSHRYPFDTPPFVGVHERVKEELDLREMEMHDANRRLSSKSDEIWCFDNRGQRVVVKSIHLDSSISSPYRITGPKPYQLLKSDHADANIDPMVLMERDLSAQIHDADNAFEAGTSATTSLKDAHSAIEVTAEQCSARALSGHAVQPRQTTSPEHTEKPFDVRQTAPPTPARDAAVPTNGMSETITVSMFSPLSEAFASTTMSADNIAFRQSQASEADSEMDHNLHSTAKHSLEITFSSLSALSDESPRNSGGYLHSTPDVIPTNVHVQQGHLPDEMALVTKVENEETSQTSFKQSLPSSAGMRASESGKSELHDNLDNMEEVLTNVLQKALHGSSNTATRSVVADTSTATTSVPQTVIRRGATAAQSFHVLPSNSTADTYVQDTSIKTEEVTEQQQPMMRMSVPPSPRASAHTAATAATDTDNVAHSDIQPSHSRSETPSASFEPSTTTGSALELLAMPEKSTIATVRDRLLQHSLTSFTLAPTTTMEAATAAPNSSLLNTHESDVKSSKHRKSTAVEPHASDTFASTQAVTHQPSHQAVEGQRVHTRQTLRTCHYPSPAYVGSIPPYTLQAPTAATEITSPSNAAVPTQSSATAERIDTPKQPALPAYATPSISSYHQHVVRTKFPAEASLQSRYLLESRNNTQTKASVHRSPSPPPRIPIPQSPPMLSSPQITASKLSTSAPRVDSFKLLDQVLHDVHSLVGASGTLGRSPSPATHRSVGTHEALPWITAGKQRADAVAYPRHPEKSPQPFQHIYESTSEHTGVWDTLANAYKQAEALNALLVSHRLNM